MSDFERWWESYWSNRTDTVEHTISRSIAYDAWWAARRNARGDMSEVERELSYRQPRPPITRVPIDDVLAMLSEGVSE